MKAVLEIDAPESCAECGLEYDGYGLGSPYCVAMECGFQVFSITEEYKDKRAPFCPLRIVEDGE